MIPQLSPRELRDWRDDATREPPLLVDVREHWEFERCHIDDSLWLPLQRLPAATGELPRDRDLVLVCHHGLRSQHAAAWLRRAGFERVHNLRGGVAAWAEEVEPTMPRY